MSQITITACPAFDSNYLWLIHNQRQAWAVDPGDADVILQALHAKALHLEGILITHHHADHTGGIAKLLDNFPNCTVAGPALENIVGVTTHMHGGQTIQLTGLDLTLHCMDVPGHTRGHIAYYLPPQDVLSPTRRQTPCLFCGDTLFFAGCGRIFEGTAPQLYASLQSIATLPDDTQVFCAHEYTASNLAFALAVEPDNVDIQALIEDVKTLRQQGKPTVPFSLAHNKRVNPFLRCHIPAVRHAAFERTLNPNLTPVQVFAALRAWKDVF